MILPDKHVSAQDSLLGVGAVLLTHLTHNRTVSQLWERTRQDPHVANYERFVLTLDLLFLMGIVEWREGTLVRRMA